MTLSSVIAASFSYTVYPFAFCLSFLAALLRTLASPLLGLGGYLVHLSLFPFRVLAKFENICIFFGTAVVVGAVTGLILYFTSSFVIQLLQLSPETGTQHGSLARGHQVAAKDLIGYRPRNTFHHRKPSSWNYLTKGFDQDSQSSRAEAPAVKRERDVYYTTWDDEKRGEQKEGGLLSTMILEEDNSSERGEY